MKEAIYIGAALGITYLVYRLTRSTPGSDGAIANALATMDPAAAGIAAGDAIQKIKDSIIAPIATATDTAPMKVYDPVAAPVAPIVNDIPTSPSQVLATVDQAISTGDVAHLDPVVVRQVVQQAVAQIQAPVKAQIMPRQSAAALAQMAGFNLS